MENPHRKPASNVELGALPPSYSAIFGRQSDERGTSSMPMAMLMPRPTAPYASELIPDEAQEDGQPMLEPMNVQGVSVSNLSNEETTANDTEEDSSAQSLVCIAIGVIFIVIMAIVICGRPGTLGDVSHAISHVRSRGHNHGHGHSHGHHG